MPQQEVKLSWSGYKQYLDCPKAYEFSQTARDKEEPTERQRYSYVFGNVMQDTFAFLYNSYLWKDTLWMKNFLIDQMKKEWPQVDSDIGLAKEGFQKIKVLSDYLVAFTKKNGINKIMSQNLYDKKILELIIKSLFSFSDASLDGYTEGLTLGVKYKPKTKEDFRKEVRESIQNTLKTILKEKLFGNYCQAEAKISYARDGLILTGYMDFLIMRPKNKDFEYLLIDGKSRTEANPDAGQLLLYTLMLMLKFGEIEIKPAFLFYKTGEMNWIQPKKALLDELYINVLKVKQLISEGKFAASEKPTCYWCGYQNLCSTFRDKRGLGSEQERRLIETDTSVRFSIEGV